MATMMRGEATKLPPDSATHKMLVWAEMELGERADRIFELEDELKRAQADADKYRLALMQVKEALQVVVKHAMLESYEISADDFARDFAPYKNAMAHHGIEPYAKPKRTRKTASA